METLRERIRKWSENDGERVTNKTSGRVTSIQPGVKLHFFTAGTFAKDKDIIGADLYIMTEDGLDKVEFPRELSEIEISALTGSRVAYSCIKSVYYEGSLGDLTGWDYQIVILEGPKKDYVIEKSITT